MASNVQHCRWCGQRFTDMTALDDHENLHRRDTNTHSEGDISTLNTVQCQICKKTFTTISNLARHRKAEHGNTTFPCPKCHKMFNRLDNFNRHSTACQKASNTSTPNTIQCQDCMKIFTTSSNLARHRKGEHGNTILLCPKCHKIFNRLDNFNRHSTSCQKDSSTLPPNTFWCQDCKKAFTTSSNLARHRKAEHGNSTLSCSKCNTIFNRLDNLERHSNSCQGTGSILTPEATLTCSQCMKVFTRAADRNRHAKICKGSDHVCSVCNKRCATNGGLRRHLLIHRLSPKKHKSNSNSNTTPKTQGNPMTGPSHYRCRRCTSTFEDRHQLYIHGMREHYQTGGALHSRPWEDDEAPWHREDGTVDHDLRNVYEANVPLILENHRLGSIQSTYNFPLNNQVTIEQLMQYALEIFRQQQHAFRLNLVFGTILRNRETGQYRYFVPYNNNGILEKPLYISKRSDLNRLRLRLSRLDITTELLRQRPDTKWIPVLISNIHFTIYNTHYPIGQGDLPEYLTKKDSIYPLTHNRQTGKPYNDHLCLFRCLALHTGYDIGSLEGPSHTYFQQWCHFRRSEKVFHGVAYEEFPEFEKLFKVNLEVYTLQEDGFASSVYKSRGREDTSLYVNLHQHHLSYIRNFAQYAQKFQCKTCDRHFKLSGNLLRHQRICSNQTKFTYPGGFHEPQQTIFDKLDEFGITVPKDQRTFPWFVCYDFEAMLQEITDHPTDQLQWTQKHVPISVSICSNVQGHTDPLCIIDADPNKLVEDMVSAMTEIADTVYELAENKWGWVLEAINKTLEEEKSNTPDNMEEEYDSVESDDEDSEKSKEKEAHPLLKLYGQMEGYMTQLPVLGFNSAKYDLNLIKPYIAKHLQIHDSKGTFVVKNHNCYTCVSTQKLKFLDISQFLAAGSSYTQFLKAYHVDQGKGFFPYQWFSSKQKLEHRALPPHSAFYSTLKGSNITEAEYDYCQMIWKERNMSTFQDFLVWYNNLDVAPFVTAVERLQQFYFQKGIDVFKTAISVPGIARQLLFSSARRNNASFALCDKNNADLYQTIKNNIVGGPSIIFTRHHKANQTRIRGEKLCKSLLGFDANGLYLNSLGHAMPVGPYIRRRAENNFRPEVRDKYMSAYYWMDWIIHTKDIPIQHKLNHGKEVRVGQYPVDGFSPATAHGKPTCYQFQGCYWHGHSCVVTERIKNKKWWAERQQKYEKTQATTQYLINHGYHVVEMWECQFKTYCHQNPQIYAFIDSQRPSYFQKHKGSITENNILEGVDQGKLFGMIEVDIQVPDQWPSYFHHPTLAPFKYFAEMSPLFCNTEVPYEVIGSHMQHHVEEHDLSKTPRRLLIGGMKGRQMLIATPLLRWYLNHGMVVTKIYQIIEYQEQRCFKDFVTDVSEARRAGDIDPDTAIIADTMKVIGNSGYESLIMDKTKHREVTYIQGENETCLKVNDPRFRKLECLQEEEQFYEMEMAKRKIKLDLPIQLGYFILQYAKLRMLEFYYDFMDVFVDRSDFEYCEMDTDSAYMAISGSSLNEVIKPSMMEKYTKGLTGYCNVTEVEADADCHWFPRTCCSKHAKFDKRTPGLFKLEYQGDEMIGLCSKTYIVRKAKNTRPSGAAICAYKLLRRYKKLKPRSFSATSHIRNEYKFSSKGISKRNIKAPMSIFRHVLKTGKSRSGTNRGFRARHNTIFTYTQERRGFSYFYCKRKVLDDGIHTVPLDITLCPVPQKPMDADDQAVADILMDLLEESNE